MRTLGVAILGLFIGLVAGLLVLHELLSRVLVSAGADIGVSWGLVIGFGPIALAVVGAVVAVVIDQRVRTRRGRS